MTCLTCLSSWLFDFGAHRAWWNPSCLLEVTICHKNKATVGHSLPTIGSCSSSAPSLSAAILTSWSKSMQLRAKPQTQKLHTTASLLANKSSKTCLNASCSDGSWQQEILCESLHRNGLGWVLLMPMRVCVCRANICRSHIIPVFSVHTSGLVFEVQSKLHDLRQQRHRCTCHRWKFFKCRVQGMPLLQEQNSSPGSVWMKCNMPCTANNFTFWSQLAWQACEQWNSDWCDLKGCHLQARFLQQSTCLEGMSLRRMFRMFQAFRGFQPPLPSLLRCQADDCVWRIAIWWPAKALRERWLAWEGL